MELTLEEMAIIYHALMDTAYLKNRKLATLIKEFIDPSRCSIGTTFTITKKL